MTSEELKSKLDQWYEIENQIYTLRRKQTGILDGIKEAAENAARLADEVPSECAEIRLYDLQLYWFDVDSYEGTSELLGPYPVELLSMTSEQLAERAAQNQAKREQTKETERAERIRKAERELARLRGEM